MDLWSLARSDPSRYHHEWSDEFIEIVSGRSRPVGIRWVLESAQQPVWALRAQWPGPLAPTARRLHG